METFLEFSKEVLNGIVRALSVYLFRKNVLEKEKTTLSHQKQKGGSQKKD